MPKFSIIVPIYNVEAYLPQCLESIAAQSFEDCEVVCVDDGSTDGSSKILEEWRERLPQMRVIHRENGGLSAARNTGLMAAQGEYILFVDSDDWIEPNTLEAISSAEQGEDIISFACRRTDSGDYDVLQHEELSGWEYYNHHALEGRKVPFVCVWQRCYRHGFLSDNGLRFREGILHEDNEFTPRVCLAAKTVMTISEVLYNYRVREGSIMTTRGLRSKKSLILVANELALMFSQREDIDRSVIYRALTQCYQAAFIDATRKEDKELLPLIDWRCYRTVSRTRPRHKIQYAAMRINPQVFRLIETHHL